MKERKTCSECGAKTVRYRHSFSKGLARSLMIWFLKFGEEPGEIRDAGFTYSQRANFQKLRYWELIEKVGDPKGKGGTWKLTKTGVAVLAGALLHKNAWTYRGETQTFDGPSVTMTSLIDGWKFRPEYAREAIVHEPGQQKLL